MTPEKLRRLADDLEDALEESATLEDYRNLKEAGTKRLCDLGVYQWTDHSRMTTQHIDEAPLSVIVRELVKAEAEQVVKNRMRAYFKEVGNEQH
jgi:hypothetical protein